MNRSYRLIWNAAQQSYQPASELARSNAKGRGRKLALALAIAAASTGALAAPQGVQVVDGEAQIHYGGSTDIHQHSDNVTLTWDSFDIDADEVVNFLQPGSDSLALNRVFSADGTQIQGQLNANGRVFIIDVNGVLFGETAQVNVGSLVASTLDVTANEDDSFSFSGNGSLAAVSNFGNITAADGGAVALLGGQVSNHGIIQARLGNVALAAGNKITLDFAGDGLLNVQVDEAALNALAENHGLLKADGGRVLMTAHASEALLQTVVNNTGVIEAQTLAEKDGQILLLGGMSEETGGTVRVSGSLDASATEGKGGFIETSGTIVKVGADAVIDTSSENGAAGTWLLDPTDLEISYDPQGGNNNTSHVHTQALQNSLSGGNVQLVTANAGTEAGNITIVDPIVWASGNRLTLDAHGNIIFNDYLHAPNGGLTLSAGGDITTGAEGHINVRSFVVENGSFSQIAATLPTFIARDFTLNGGTFTRAAGGAGTSASPWQITDIYGLQGLGTTLDAHAELANSIDASGTASWNGGAGFAPIGTIISGFGFTGSLNGQGFVIDGLTINRSGRSYVGLFGRIEGADAALSNIGLENAVITGNFWVGGLAGANAGSITNSYATGRVTGAYEVGGLVGNNGGGISNSYATSAVNGGSLVGGLVGDNYGEIETSYATGAVTGTGVGGLVGSNVGGSITDSYWDSHTTGISPIGPGSTVVNGDWDTLVPGDSAYSAVNYDGFDFTTDWFIAEGSSRPMLRAFLSGDGSISNLYQLQGMAADLDGDYTLTQNIDASATASTDNADVWGGRGFAPVGMLGAEFTGSLDGAGFVIGGLTINRPDQNYVGLFGLAGNTATLTGIGLEGGVITGNNYVGGLVGWNNGDIASSYATGAVDGNNDVGGLVGWNNGDIASSYWDSYTTGMGATGVGSNDGTFNATPVNGNWATLVPGDSAYSADNYTGFDFTPSGDWFIADGSSRPMLRAFLSEGFVTDGEIHNLYDLQGMAAGLAGSYTLTQDIDASATADSVAAGNSGDYSDIWGGRGFAPVGRFDDPFTGSLNGNGFVIDGLTINRSDQNDVGLFGYSSGELRNMGLTQVSITGNRRVGGLVGHSAEDGSISRSYATGEVGGTTLVGGVVGLSDNSINQSYAISLVTGDDYIGGLVGRNAGNISQSYATGAVTGISDVGGLAGENHGEITNSYATGAVTGDLNVGGLVGTNNATVSGSFWNTDVEAVGVGDGDATGATGLTTAEFTDPASFAAWGTAINTDGSGTAVWRLYEGNSAPLLRTFLTDIDVIAYDDYKVYDGNAYDGHHDINSSTGAGVRYGTSYAEFLEVFGEDGTPYSSDAVNSSDLTYEGDSQGAVDAGTYTITPGNLWSTQSGFNIQLVDGELTIDQMVINLSINIHNGSKVYGEADPSFNWNITSGSLAPGDTARLNLRRQPGENVGNYTIRGTPTGDLASGNYDVTLSNGVFTIRPRPITIDITDLEKVYGEDDPTLGWTISGGSLAFNDTLSGTLTRVSGENVGDYAIAGELEGNLASGNYTVTVNEGVLTITPRSLVISVEDLAKIYGEDDPEYVWAQGGSLAEGDTVSVAVTREAGEDVGNYTLTPTVNGDVMGENYNLTIINGELVISPAALTVTADDIAAYWNLLPPFTATVDGLANGDTVADAFGNSLDVTSNLTLPIPGDYILTPAGTLASNNYTVSFASGTLTLLSSHPGGNYVEALTSTQLPAR